MHKICSQNSNLHFSMAGKIADENTKNSFCDSDEDVPLSSIKNVGLRSIENVTTKPHKNALKSKLKTQHLKLKKTMSNPSQDRKKILAKSDSESSDFGKYTYFDERRIKRKVKINKDVSVDDLRRKIREIKLENVCLMKENERINEVKLKERMSLREEILRLRNNILNLELQNHLKNLTMTNNKGPNEIIRQLLDDAFAVMQKDSIINIETLRRNVKKFAFTKREFWDNFNSIENKLSPHGPYWFGNLSNITPNYDQYYKPLSEIVEALRLNEEVEYYPYENFTWNEKPNSVSKKKYKIIDSDKLNDSHIVADVTSMDLSGKNNSNINQSTIEKNLANDIFPAENVDGDLQHEDTSNANDSFEDYNENIENPVTEPDLRTCRMNMEEADKDEEGICTECGYGTSWSSFIARHREAFSKNIMLTPCDTCNMKFLKSGHFDGRHRLKRPPPLKYRPATFMCSECGERCTSKSGLKQHALKHKEAQYACHLCNYKCRRKAYLKVHIKVHGSLKSLPNDQNCDAESSINQLLPLEMDKNTSELHTDLSKKQYSCIYCTYTTSSKSYLKSHIDYHTGFKQFKCDKCPYQCVTSTRMNSHKKIHNGIKDFACRICNYKTTSNYNLNVHTRKHEKV